MTIFWFYLGFAITIRIYDLEYITHLVKFYNGLKANIKPVCFKINILIIQEITERTLILF